MRSDVAPSTVFLGLDVHKESGTIAVLLNETRFCCDAAAQMAVLITIRGPRCPEQSELASAARKDTRSYPTKTHCNGDDRNTDQSHHLPWSLDESLSDDHGRGAKDALQGAIIRQNIGKLPRRCIAKSTHN